LVDYNRAGVPLVEIVGAPDLSSSDQARAYVDELRSILVATGASDGRMEEGSLRVDANVSVRPLGSTTLSTRCEIKNMNSLRSLGRAIDYEAGRQVALLEAGDRVRQETRHWNETEGTTRSMRSKEEAFDYRYFPEPDLVPLVPDSEWIGQVAAGLSPMPTERRAALGQATGLGSQAEAVVTVVRLGLDDLVLAAVAGGADGALAVRRAANEVASDLEQAKKLEPSAFVKLLEMEHGENLTTAQARQVLRQLLAEGGDPADIAAALGFEALGAGTLDAVIDQVIAANPAEWTRFSGGEDKLTGFFVAQIKKATAGNADLGKATALLRQRRQA
jgi:aspartyl-tRNA(Asn)/glutamyl-tRNA(Gln) amidotransferase subunit B